MVKRFTNMVPTKFDTKTINQIDERIENTRYDRSKYIREAVKEKLKNDREER